MATIYASSTKQTSPTSGGTYANYRAPASSVSAKSNTAGNPVYANTPAQRQTVIPSSQGGANTGGGSGGSGQVQQQQNFSQAPMEQHPDQPNIDFDAMIAPAIQGLESAIAPLQQGFADYEKGQLGQADTAKASTNQQISEQQGILGQKGVQQTNLANDAQDQARRLYSEMSQGIQARYGGTTGTGAFAEGQLGNQTLQQIGKVRESLSQSMSEISDKLLQVKEIGRIALQDIQDKTQERILQAKSQLEQNLASIRQQKGELQARKAEMAANAIQIYQQRVAEVNARNTQFQQQLYVQQQNAQQTLQQSLARGKQLAESFSLHNYQVGLDNPVGYRQGSRGTTTDLNGNPIQIPQGAQLSGVGTYDPNKLNQDPNAVPEGLL